MSDTVDLTIPVGVTTYRGGRITEQVKNGEWTVKAERVGPFAIHENVDAIPVEPFAISHVGTGYRLTQAKSRAEARRIIKRVLALKLDWTWTDPEVPRKWPKETVVAIRKAAGHIK